MRRVISQSIWRKVLATLVAVAGFVMLYEAKAFDTFDLSTFIQSSGDAAPTPGSRLQFAATAYCKGSTTASGVGPRTGIAAADQSILPVGSVVSITTDEPKYDGIYTIMDTGPQVRGHELDVYMWSCYEALAFGRKEVQMTVLRLGWNPRASMPGLIDRIFRRREGD
jgi:3D (Asp-Asp-Asp) domain-containing protein